ncbi:MAG: hypothetical protein ACI3VA_11725 [Candidatus Limivicinus sp.]
MKKAISLLLALVLCFMLAACGSSGTGNEDYDYIISLLDRGEYDMAIQVIEMLRTGSSAVPPQAEVPDSAPEAQTEASADIARSDFTFTGPGEASLDAPVILENGTDYHFHMDLFNSTDRELTLQELIITDYENGNKGEDYPLDIRQFQGWSFYTLAPNTGDGFDDWHPTPAPFDARDYTIVYQDEDKNEYRVTYTFDLAGALEVDVNNGGSDVSGLDYSQDQGKDLMTLRYDADYVVEVHPDVYWVPARSLGDSQYSNAEIFQMLQASPEDKQAAVSTLYEALQLYQVGGFASADDNIRMRENGIDWEHHKPGYYAVLTNCGCCATDSNWLHYILDGDYDEIGYIATSQRDGSGHVFNYILQDGWYYMIDLTHYRTDWIATATEDGYLDSYHRSDPILGNIHKTRSPEAYADYIQAAFSDPPGLIVKYTAADAPAVDSVRSQSGIEITYAQMNDIELEILFDDPGDSLTFTFTDAPSQFPNWA